MSRAVAVIGDPGFKAADLQTVSRLAERSRNAFGGRGVEEPCETGGAPLVFVPTRHKLDDVYDLMFRQLQAAAGEVSRARADFSYFV